MKPNNLAVRLFLVLSLLLLFGLRAKSQLIENKGQWHNDVLFMKEYASGVFYLDKQGFTLLMHDDLAWSKVVQHGHDDPGGAHSNHEDITVKMHALKLRFEGASSMSDDLIAYEKYPHHFNYFLGSNPENWASKVQAFRRLMKKNLYPNIDLEIKETELGYKYNFILNPGANIEDIKILIQGHEGLKLDQGVLKMKTSLGWIEERIPASFIVNGTGMEPVAVNYKIDEEGYVRFHSSAKWNKRILIIDPELVFSTYSGSTVDNFGFTAAFDETGHLYAGGIVTSPYTEIPELRNGRYPASAGAFQQTFSGGENLTIPGRNFPCDITLSKYSPDGKQLIYATYLGGVSNEYPHSLIVAPNDELIVFGTTMSINFPTVLGAYQSMHGGAFDMFVSRFSADGNRLIGSTYIGASGMDGFNDANNLKYFYADEFRGEVNLSPDGDILIASSSSSRDFPVTPGAFQPTYAGGLTDGVVMKFSPDLKELKFGSFLGGTVNDALYSVDVHPITGEIYVSGGTNSGDLKATANTLGTTNMGGRADGFVSVISSDGSRLVKSMYWGTARYDQIFSLDISTEGNIFVIGQSEGSMPVTAGVYHNANSGIFISSFNADLDVLRFSTVIGASRNVPDFTINAFMVDECGKIYGSGWGGLASSNPYFGGSTTRNLPLTPDAAFKTTDGSDFYLFVLAAEAAQLLYATYIGGSRTNDHVDGGTSRFDKRGTIYQSVCASCPQSYPSENRISDFPTSSDAFSTSNPSPRCSNAAFKFEVGNINFKPVVRDTLLRVRVLDTLDFIYSGWDTDRDSVGLSFFLPDSLRPFVQIEQVNGIWPDTARARFVFVPQCVHFPGDTIRIPVRIDDRGCPYREDSVAMISIVIDPPPLLPPPEVVCLTFGENNEFVRISWEDGVRNKYSDKIFLYRVNPDGTTLVLDSSSNTSASAYTDYQVTSPTLNNYEYYLRIRNVCGNFGDSSYLVSTTKEYESPIIPSRVFTVTVEGNKNLRIFWTRSDEEDFKSYVLYKRQDNKGKEGPWEKIAEFENREDTVYLDLLVDVANQVYCYMLKVRDLCGNTSAESNIGCSIVLRGDEPPFAFNLYWNPYVGWENGIESYEMFSAVDTGSLRSKFVVNGDVNFLTDANLNYDWGGYWYQVEATEGTEGYGAKSLSNAIYLIQPPLLHVPNAFTPNSDGLNELWGIVPVFVKEYDLKVYDRWGGKVFETTSKHEIWDGFVNGVITPQSVFVYTITYTGWDRSVRHVKGTVTILK